MNFQPVTFYCDKCEALYLGDSCLLHPVDKLFTTLPEPVADWELEFDELFRHIQFCLGITASEECTCDYKQIKDYIRKLLGEKEEKAYEEGLAEGKSEGYGKGLNDGFSQAKSEVIKKMRKWYEKRLKGETHLSDLDAFLSELEK